MEATTQRIGRNIRRLRKQTNLSQEQLGTLSGIHRVYLGKLELGKVNPTVKILSRISKALHVDILELFKRIE